MEEKALHYHAQGMDCGKCLFLSATDTYPQLPKEIVKISTAISTGFGIGSLCSCLVAGVIIISFLATEEDAKFKRLCLMLDFEEKFKNINCSFISKDREKCDEIISFVSNWIELNL